MPNQLLQLPFDGGINLLQDRKRIADNEAVKTKNLIPLQPGIIGKRKALQPGLSYEMSSFASEGATHTPTSLVTSPFIGPVFGAFTAYAEGSAMGPVAGHYLTALVDDAASTSIFLGDSTLTTPQYMSWNRILYCFGGPGSNATAYKLDLDNLVISTSFQPWSFTSENNSGLRPKVAALYKNRFVYANFGPGHTSSIVFADPNEPEVIGPNALTDYFIRIGAEGGDEVVALIPLLQTAVGSPADEVLLVLKQYSAYIITNEPILTTQPIDPETGTIGSMTVGRLSYDVGCASANTVARTPYGIIWASHDDVWMFNIGQLPVRIGTKIRPALTATPSNLRWKWHAAYHDGFYRLAVFAEGQGPNELSACGEQYWLDLRNGPPQSHIDARWWGPQVYRITDYVETLDYYEGTTCMANEQRPGAEPKLYTIQRHLYDDGTATLFKTICVFDQEGTNDRDTADDESSDPLNIDYLDLYGRITFELLSKEYDFQDPLIRKLFQGVEVNHYNSWNSRLNLHLHLDGGREVIEMTKDFAPTGWNLNVDDLDSDTLLSREFQSYVFKPDSSVRALGGSVQLRMFEEAGHTIVEGYNDTFIFGQSNDVTLGTWTDGATAALTITPGFYTSTDLIDAICTAMNAQSAIFAVTQGVYPAGTFTATFPVLHSGKCRIDATNSINWLFIGADWPAYGEKSLYTATQLASSTRLLGMFGFRTTNDTATFAQVADDQVTQSYTSGWQFGTLALRWRPIPRRPQ